MWRRTLKTGLVLLGMAGAVFSETVVVPEFEAKAARDYLLAVAKEFRDQTGPMAETLLMEARLQSELGRHDEAERLARLAFERDPKRADIPSFLADLHIRQDRLEEASKCLRLALELDPKLAGGYRRLGMVLDRLGDRPGAQNLFLKGIQQDSTDSVLYLLLGRLLLDQGRFQESADYLTQACQLDPELASAFYALSQAKSRLGDQPAARAALEKFQKLKEREKAVLDAQNSAYNSQKALQILASNFHEEAAAFFVQQHREDLAETNLLRAIKVSSQEANPYEALASIYMKKGRWESARDVCQELVRRWPAQAAYRAKIGRASCRERVLCVV